MALDFSSIVPHGSARGILMTCKITPSTPGADAGHVSKTFIVAASELAHRVGMGTCVHAERGAYVDAAKANLQR